MLSILVGVAFVLVSVLASYKLAHSFFSSAHASTDKSGDFGMARGSVFAVGLPSVLCMGVLALINTYLLAINNLGLFFSLVMVGGFGAGFTGAFRAVLSGNQDNKSE